MVFYIDYPVVYKTPQNKAHFENEVMPKKNILQRIRYVPSAI